MLAATFICGSSVFTACSNNDAPETPPSQDEVEEQLQKMTLREKVGQLFYVRPECLDTTIHFNQPSGIDGSTDDIKEIKMQAFDAVVKAVEDGRLTEQRIDESVRRVLKLKKQMGR